MNTALEGEQEFVSLTPEAARRLAPLLNDGDVQHALRIMLQPGGCSGLVYEVSFDSDQRQKDDVVVYSRNIPIVLSREDASAIRGATIDFEETGFSIVNPHARSPCACGASFAPLPSRAANQR
jgi:iron-sulfur cluster assembly accessory protein